MTPFLVFRVLEEEDIFSIFRSQQQKKNFFVSSSNFN
jgi:hypothetical protein